jgi:hypothetical protein
MSKQPNSLSENPRILERAYHAVGGALSHPDARRPAIGRDTYINVSRPVAGLAGPSTNLPPENFFKNILLREVKDPAIRISVGDHFGMEEAINPCHRSFSCQVPRSRLGSADQPAKASSPLPIMWVKTRASRITVCFLAPRKILTRTAKSFCPFAVFAGIFLAMTKDPKLRLPLADPEFWNPSKEFFGRPEILHHSQFCPGRCGHDN